MGWYRTVTSKFSSTYESKIVKSDAEKLARRRLFYKGNASPAQDYVDGVVKSVISELESTYGSLDKIRRASSSEELTQLIEKAVIKVLP